MVGWLVGWLAVWLGEVRDRSLVGRRWRVGFGGWEGRGLE